MPENVVPTRRGGMSEGRSLTMKSMKNLKGASQPENRWSADG